MRYEIVFFDFDGTLVDSATAKKAAFFRLFPQTKSHSIVIEHVLHLYPDESRYEVIPRIVEAMQDKGVEVDRFEGVTKLIELYSDQVLNAVARAPEKDGATNILEYLTSNGVLTYLCSNTPEPELAKLVCYRRWKKYFARISGYPNRKEEFVRECLQWNGVSPDRAMLVGDGLSDKLAAQCNGIKFFPIKNLDDLRSLAEELKIADDV